MRNIFSNNITKNNFLRVLSICGKYDLKEVENACNEFLLDNFGAMVKASSLYDMPEDRRCKYISIDRFKLPSEEIEVFRAVSNWIKQAWFKNDTDSLSIFETLKFVRFPFIPHDILMDEVLKAPLVYESQHYRSLVIQAIKCHGDSFIQPLQEGQQYAPRGESKLVLIPCGKRDSGYLVKDTETKMHVVGDTEDGPFAKEDEVRTFPFSFAFRSDL